MHPGACLDSSPAETSPARPAAPRDSHLSAHLRHGAALSCEPTHTHPHMPHGWGTNVQEHPPTHTPKKHVWSTAFCLSGTHTQHSAQDPGASLGVPARTARRWAAVLSEFCAPSLLSRTPQGRVAPATKSDSSALPSRPGRGRGVGARKCPGECVTCPDDLLIPRSAAFEVGTPRPDRRTGRSRSPGPPGAPPTPRP